MTTVTALPTLAATVLIGWTARRGRCELKLELRPHDVRLPDGTINGQDYELSICGDVWLPSGRDIEAGGQHMTIGEDVATWAEGWSPERLAGVVAIWDRWHLNGMRAGCEHQRTQDTTRKVEVVSYKLTSEAYHMREKALQKATQAGLAGTALDLNPTERALAELTDWFKDRYAPPDADSPLSGCYEVDKREQKAIGWTYPAEHPDGLLGKPCDVCGYKYGNSWLFEPLPADVLDTIKSLISENR